MNTETLKIVNFQKVTGMACTRKTFIFLVAVMSIFVEFFSGVVYADMLDSTIAAFSSRFEAVEKRLNSIEARLSALDGLSAKLVTAEEGIKTLKAAAERNQEKTEKIKAETTATTTNIETLVATAREELKKQEAELQRQKKKFEDYLNKLEQDAIAESVHKKRQERFFDAINDILFDGEIQDVGMEMFFTKASKYDTSGVFGKLYAELKTVRALRRLFKQKTIRLAEIFEALLEQHKDLRDLIDQPAQPVIDGVDKEPPKLLASLVKDL